MMYRGGGKGGCWADFFPRGFFRPRPLPSRCNLYPSSHLPSLCSLTSLVHCTLCLFLICLPTTMPRGVAADIATGGSAHLRRS
jgi:hypothetical protein